VDEGYEVEYRNLELCFDRRQIHEMLRWLVREGYSLFWHEGDAQLIVSIRLGRKLVKMKFERTGERFKMMGDYSFRDGKLSEWMEKMINDTRGHAIVRRFEDRRVRIENIMFGEIVRTVEIVGSDRKTVYSKHPVVTYEDMLRAFRNRRAEERIPVLRLELDYELATLYDALQSGDDDQIRRSTERLNELRLEMLRLEV